MRSFTSLFIVCGLGGVASANAFAVAEQGAEDTGRGNATVATESGPSSIFYNPAGMALDDGLNVELGTSVVWLHGGYKPTGATSSIDTNSPVQPVPTAFVSARIHEMVAVGIGFTVPFGAKISYDANAPTTDVLKDQTLRTYFISPVVALNLYKYVPGLSIGGGIDIVPATVEINQDVVFGDTKGTGHLGGSATGIGGRAGVMYAPPALPQLSLGVMWRSQVKEDFTGTGNFSIAQPYRSQLPADGDISTSITLPMAITGGVAVRPIPQLELEADVIWMNWSKFDVLDVTAQTFGGGTTHIVTQEQYKDTTSVRVGAEYQLPDLGLSLRAGYIYDPTPIKPAYVSVALPDADRNDLTLGASYDLGDYKINASALLVLPTSQQTETGGANDAHQGKYDVSGFVASLSVQGHFHLGGN